MSQQPRDTALLVHVVPFEPVMDLARFHSLFLVQEIEIDGAPQLLGTSLSGQPCRPSCEVRGGQPVVLPASQSARAWILSRPIRISGGVAGPVRAHRSIAEEHAWHVVCLGQLHRSDPISRTTDVCYGSLAGLADWAAPTRGMAASDREQLITLVPVSRYSLIDQGTAADNVHREAFIVTVSVPVS
jgi:hypothetical protein